jgi:hypothetical protein
MSSNPTFWHSAASLLQRIGDASMARARMRAISRLDAHALMPGLRQIAPQPA